MTISLARATRALGLAVAIFGLVATGLLLTVSRPAGAGTSVPTLDHFLCYQARETGIKAPPNVLLKNEIQPNPFAPVFGAASAHCNPANKLLRSGRLFTAKNPLAHLSCFTIKFQAAPVAVTLANQFGKAVMTTGSPTHFCLPSWKSNIAPPHMPTPAPPGLDHFTCYPLKAVASSYGFRPAGPKAEDEFSAPKYTTLKLGTANQLCVPTTKIVAGAVFSPQGPNDLSLVCFPTQPTPIWKLVFDQNQFGEARVFPLVDNEEFCVPSTAVVQPAGAS